MVTSDSHSPLLPHPGTPCEAGRRVAARVDWVNRESLRFGYVLAADEGRVRIPPPAAAPGRTDGLWAHTCFEAFVALPRTPGYLELNFSPSGEWAAYRFESYRQGMAPALGSTPRLTLRRDGEGLELQALVSLSGILPAAAGDEQLRIALSAVVEDRQGGLSYWALRHPPGRPDFHHRDGFALALDFPGQPLDSP